MVELTFSNFFEMKLVILISIVIQIINCDWSLVPKEITYKYKRSECSEFNKKFIFNASCANKFVKRATTIPITEVNFVPGIEVDNIFLLITTFKRFNTVYRPIMFKYKESVCDILNNKSTSYVSQQLYRIYENTKTNFLEPCPFKGRKFKIAEENGVKTWSALPPLVPIGDWKIVYKFTTTMNGPEEFLIDFAEVYEVIQKTATQF